MSFTLLPGLVHDDPDDDDDLDPNDPDDLDEVADDRLRVEVLLLPLLRCVSCLVKRLSSSLSPLAPLFGLGGGTGRRERSRGKRMPTMQNLIAVDTRRQGREKEKINSRSWKGKENEI
jgi:hypothetical protein